MMRLLHLLPIIMIIACVTAALRAEKPEGFKREFLKASGSLAAGFVGLAIIVLLVTLLLSGMSS